MSIKPPGNSAFTLTEIIVVLVIVIVIFLMARPQIHVGLTRGQMTQVLSNMKQLHLATQQMALDGKPTKDTNLGWPGDTGGTFSNWTKLLVPDYLTTNDLCKLLSAAGKVVPLGTVPTIQDTAVRVYDVSKNSDSHTVFLTTANFTNTPAGGLPLESSAKPYGNKGFVVFRQGGDGAILLPKQTGDTNIIGTYAPLLR